MMTNFSSNLPSVVNNQDCHHPSDSYTELEINHLERSPLSIIFEEMNPELAYDLKPKTHGSARFMVKDEIIRLGLTIPGKNAKIALFIGVLRYEHNKFVYIAIYARSPCLISNPQNDDLPEGNGHGLIFAPTRAGKGVCYIISNVLYWLGSLLVIDIKGEIYFHTAGYRETVLKQNVFRIAPFENESDVWNPIMGIRGILIGSESTPEQRCQEEEDARYLANLCITPSDSPGDIFWECTARNFLVGLLLHVRTAEIPSDMGNEIETVFGHRVCERSMREVGRLLNLGVEAFPSLLGDMCESKKTLIRYAGNSLAHALTGEGKPGISIQLMLKKQTEAWSNERVHKATYKPSADPDDREPAPNDFSFSQMRDDNTSIYLIIPPEYLEDYSSVLRVMVGFAMRDLKDSYTTSKKDPGFQDKPPVLLMLDEFPQLGYMQPIENALSYIAGYGVRLWFFIQDLSQLKLHYKKSWQTFLANTEFKSFFGVNDIDTASLVSEMIGTATVDDSNSTNASSFSATKGYQYGNHSSYSENRSSNSSSTSSHTARRLMTPDEILHMPQDKQLFFIKGLNPIYCDLVKYYEDEELLAYSKIPPPKDVNF
jgi:type IV secretion system protein VirD4